MSAWLVTDKHIGALALAGVTLRLSMWEFDPEVAIAAWVEANQLSIEARYPDTVGHPERAPGPVSGRGVIDWESAPRLTPIEVIKACDCLAYQSCEYDGWNDSKARRLLDDLKSAAINALPGYQEAPWGID